ALELEGPGPAAARVEAAGLEAGLRVEVPAPACADLAFQPHLRAELCLLALSGQRVALPAGGRLRWDRELVAVQAEHVAVEQRQGGTDSAASDLVRQIQSTPCLAIFLRETATQRQAQIGRQGPARLREQRD